MKIVQLTYYLTYGFLNDDVHHYIVGRELNGDCRVSSLRGRGLHSSERKDVVDYEGVDEVLGNFLKKN